MSPSPEHEPIPESQPPARTAAPARLRDRLREQTHAAILDAAERTVTEHGTALAHIDAIAATAGVSVGTLYNHFTDRDALVAAVIRDRRSVLLGHLDALVADPQTDFTHKLVQFFVLFADAGARHGQFFAVVMGEHGGLRSWQCQREETVATWFALSRRLLEQGVQEGVVNAENLDLHATVLMTLARAVVIAPTAQVPPILAGQMAHFFLHGAASKRPDVPAGDGSLL